jgi:hypothetical protein
VHAQLDLGAAPVSAAAHWISDTTTYATAHGGDVAVVMSSIGSAIHAHDPSADATYAAALPHLTTTVQTDLAHSGTLPLQVLSQFATDAATTMQSPTVDIAVDVAAASGAVTNVTALTVRSITVTLDPLTPDVHVDDVAFSPASSGMGMIAVSGSDRAAATITAMNLSFPMIAQSAAGALLARMGVTATRDWLHAQVACMHIATLLTGSTGTCDVDCVVGGCQAGLDQLAAPFDMSVANTAMTHQQINVAFEGPAVGVAGSLRLATIGPGPIVGSFTDDPTSAIVGSATMQPR